MNQIKILLFATLRERAGGERFIMVILPDGATVQMLKEKIAGEYPLLEPSMKSVLVTINREYATDGALLSEGAEVAMFPPVSGG
jgi:molybdopterin converting factor subunit 1